MSTATDEPDIVTANEGSNSVSELLGQGDGTFAEPLGQTRVPDRDVPQLVSLNGDTFLDALSLDQTTHQILFRAGTGDPAQPFASLVAVNSTDRPAVDFTLAWIPTGGS